MNDLLERAKGLLERCVHVGAWTERQKADWILEQGSWLSDLAAHKPTVMRVRIDKVSEGNFAWTWKQEHVACISCFGTVEGCIADAHRFAAKIGMGIEVENE